MIKNFKSATPLVQKGVPSQSEGVAFDRCVPVLIFVSFFLLGSKIG